ncbi:hypothetical protein NPIL_282431 [Nephila pilipes]|uniref:Uncharacterized protein n=1 Tax=Nephila pilipes TaxID=299642 RepID=A0A8X6N0J7_NEPPI|nr:hypothetical protein NPIL_282431 [Nephila pilipes]
MRRSRFMALPYDFRQVAPELMGVRMGLDLKERIVFGRESEAAACKSRLFPIWNGRELKGRETVLPGNYKKETSEEGSRKRKQTFGCLFWRNMDVTTSGEKSLPDNKTTKYMIAICMKRRKRLVNLQLKQ